MPSSKSCSALRRWRASQSWLAIPPTSPPYNIRTKPGHPVTEYDVFANAACGGPALALWSHSKVFGKRSCIPHKHSGITSCSSSPQSANGRLSHVDQDFDRVCWGESLLIREENRPVFIRFRTIHQAPRKPYHHLSMGKIAIHFWRGSSDTEKLPLKVYYYTPPAHVTGCPSTANHKHRFWDFAAILFRTRGWYGQVIYQFGTTSDAFVGLEASDGETANPQQVLNFDTMIVASFTVPGVTAKVCAMENRGIASLLDVTKTTRV